MEHILENIKRIRKQKGYSHEYIAYKLNISQVAYSKLENSLTKLSVERLYKIAEILETKLGDILEVNSNAIFYENIKDKVTFAGHLEIQKLYKENKDKSDKIIALYEACLVGKDELIEKLQRMIK